MIVNLTEGDVVVADGIVGVLAEKRDEILKIITLTKNADTIFAYVPAINAVRAPVGKHNDVWKELYRLFTVAKSFSDKHAGAFQKAHPFLTTGKSKESPSRTPIPAGAKPTRGKTVGGKIKMRTGGGGGGRPGYTLIRKPVRRQGKTFIQSFWVKNKDIAPPKPSKQAKTLIQQEKDRREAQIEESVAKSVTPWDKHMTPSESEFTKIQQGDSNAMGQYIMRVLWEPVAGIKTSPKVGKTIAGQKVNVDRQGIAQGVRKLSIALMGARPEGFEYEDVLQEVAMRVLVAQSKGRFAADESRPAQWKDKPVSRADFKSFIANTVKKTAWDIVRAQRLDKRFGESIENMMDKIEGKMTKEQVEASTVDVEKDAIEQAEMDPKVQRMKQVIGQTANSLKKDSRQILSMLLENKSHQHIAAALNTTVNAVKGKVKRVYSKFGQALAAEKLIDPSAVSSAKDLKPVLQSVLNPIAAERKRRTKIKREAGPGSSTGRVSKAALKTVQIERVDGNVILKGKPAQEGEVRVHGGVKKKKVGGKWVPVGEGAAGDDKKRQQTEGRVGKEKGKLASMKKERRKVLTSMLKNIAQDLMDMLATTMRGESAAEQAAEPAAEVGRAAEEKAEGKEKVSKEQVTRQKKRVKVAKRRKKKTEQAA